MKAVVLLLLAALVVLCASAPAPQVATAAQNENDLKTLNYALTLEHLEATYYREGLARLSEADFVAAGYTASTRNYISLIAAHEASHVELLTGAIFGVGGMPAEECIYNFGGAFNNVTSFITTAAALEVTGTRAYDGAANTINSAAYLEIAAQIATVEARHSAYLFELMRMSPFPEAFEMALSPEAVYEAVRGLLADCGNQSVPQLPEPAYLYVPLSSNYTYMNYSGHQQTMEQYNNDNDVLNYALTLENLGGYFYTQASNWSRTDFVNAGFESAYDPFQMIIGHEKAHLEFLLGAVTSRGAVPVPPATYNLGNALSNVANTLDFARILENTEVAAYDGAINRLTDFNLIQGAATIATVEARHAQYLNNLLLGVPVNNASLDDAFAPEVILNITAGFFGAGFVAPTVPVVAYTLQAFGTTAVPTPTPVPTVCPTPTPTPSTCGTPSPSPSTCGNQGSCGCNNNNNDGVTINFYFADMLRGL